MRRKIRRLQRLYRRSETTQGQFLIGISKHGKGAVEVLNVTCPVALSAGRTMMGKMLAKVIQARHCQRYFTRRYVYVYKPEM
jgi:hypothetical protein